MSQQKGLITQELFQYTLNNLRYYSNVSTDRRHMEKVVRIRHNTHIPFFALGLLPRQTLPKSLLTGEFSTDPFDAIYGSDGYLGSPDYTRFLKNCLEKEYYSVLLLSDPSMDYVETGNELVETLRRRAYALITSDRTNHGGISRYVHNSGVKSMARVYDSVKMLNTWLMHAHKVGVEYSSYLTNMYFMAEMGGKRTHASSDMKILFCVMVKKENILLVRGHFVSNTPIPSSLLELWVDSSLEAQGNKMKPHFRKYIKSKSEAAGISIKYFDTLNDEILHTMKHQSFVSLEDSRKWTQEKLQEYYKYIHGEIVLCNGDIPMDENRMNPMISKFVEMVGEAI